MPGFRQTARRGPCADGRQGSRGRRGCASGAGSRGCGCDAGCWAGRCAWSRENSHRSMADGTVSRMPGGCTWHHPENQGRDQEALWQRPANGTGSRVPGQTHQGHDQQHPGCSLSTRHAAAIRGFCVNTCTHPWSLLASRFASPYSPDESSQQPGTAIAPGASDGCPPIVYNLWTRDPVRMHVPSDRPSSRPIAKYRCRSGVTPGDAVGELLVMPARAENE